jgi:serine/threonine protein kinase
MHGNGVTHRDLKPSNILIADGHPKITDFGFCDIAGSAKPKMFYNVGSPSYMSPEAYMDNIYGEKSDVWAAGGILYEMLVGSTIDKGKKNITELYEYLKAGRQFVPNGISPFSKTTLTECFKYDSRKRSNFHALEILLDNALGPMQQQQISTVHQSNIVSPQQHRSVTITTVSNPFTSNDDRIASLHDTIPSTTTTNTKTFENFSAQSSHTTKHVSYAATGSDLFAAIANKLSYLTQTDGECSR